MDKIQEYPRAITALRYFYEEMPKLHIIGAGSLLEFALRSENFKIPVGRVEYLYMYPISFSEFLIAIGEKVLKEYLDNFKNLKKIPLELHHKISEYIKSRDIRRCKKSKPPF